MNYAAALCGCFFISVAAVAAEREEVVGSMIEALESRELLSVPNIAGHWIGSVSQSINGGAEQKGHLAVQFAQRGKSITCVEADTYGPQLTYCRGTIDSKGRLKLNWSEHRSMRPVSATGVGRLSRGKISFVLAGNSGDGTPVVIGFRIHRG